MAINPPLVRHFAKVAHTGVFRFRNRMDDKELHTVKVFSLNGKKLFNCRPARARRLLDSGRARVVSVENGLTIQLTIEEGDIYGIYPGRQDVTE